MSRARVQAPAPLNWAAQIAAHAAYLDAHRNAAASPVRKVVATARGKRTTVAAEYKREALLNALSDGQPHPFRDLRAALPEMSCQGIYYLIDCLGAEGRITVTEVSRTQRTYQLAQETP